jgi:hypothetical protein
VPAVANVAYVLFLLMYFWAIVGMELWGNIRLDENDAVGINRHANFKFFPVSMITEFRYGQRGAQDTADLYRVGHD